MSRSSSGLGHRPFTAVTGVRVPYGIPSIFCFESIGVLETKKRGNSSVVEHNLAKVGVASSNLVSRSKSKRKQPKGCFFCLWEPRFHLVAIHHVPVMAPSGASASLNAPGVYSRPNSKRKQPTGCFFSLWGTEVSPPGNQIHTSRHKKTGTLIRCSGCCGMPLRSHLPGVPIPWQSEPRSLRFPVL